MFAIYGGLLLFFIYCAARITAKTVSYTATGDWKPAVNNECEQFRCTPTNYTFVPDVPFRLYDHQSACAALVEKGVSKIYFHGDSYMRQLYAALLITLNGDFRYGSLANATLSAECEYQRQFYEKRCGTRQLNHYGIVCGGKVALDPYLVGLGQFY